MGASTPLGGVCVAPFPEPKWKWACRDESGLGREPRSDEKLRPGELGEAT